MTVITRHEKFLEEWGQLQTPGFKHLRRSHRVVKHPHPELPEASTMIAAEAVVNRILSQCDQIGITVKDHQIEHILNQLFKSDSDGSCFGAVSRLLKHCDKQTPITAAVHKLSNDYSNILLAQVMQKIPIYVQLKNLEAAREILKITTHIRLDNFHCFLLRHENQFLQNQHTASTDQIASNQLEIDALKAKASHYEKLLEKYPEKIDMIDRLFEDLRNLGIEKQILCTTSCPFIGSEEDYQTAFEMLISPFPKSAILRGTIQLPRHIMAFEKNSEGLYLFDTIKGKYELFHFTNENYPKYLHQFIKYDKADALEETEIVDGRVLLSVTSCEMSH